MTHQERKNLHYGFMCAAMSGSITVKEIPLADLYAEYCSRLADAALKTFEARWAKEDEEQEIARKEAFNAPNPYTESTIV